MARRQGSRIVRNFAGHPMTLGFLFLVALPALPCTCVVAANSDARTVMGDVSVVFRGAVVERSVLPQRVEMKGRGRYAITFRVDEYWKGDLGRSVTLYGVDAGTDCLGDGGYAVGKDYLVYASEVAVKDVTIEGLLWYWADLLPPGTKMLVPQTACMPGGEVSTVRKAVRQLGNGRTPAKTD
jgi:hypothetical protein